ncbi:MAG: heme o synthase [Anaerolineales bacterium]
MTAQTEKVIRLTKASPTGAAAVFKSSERPQRLARPKALDFWELTKPRITLMIVLTTLVGFYLGSTAAFDFARLLHTLIGTALTAGGASALNMLLERDVDARMRRTHNRPLPAGRLKPGEALAFGVLLSAAGMLYLTLMVNRLSGLLGTVTLILYLFGYTPLKRKTSLCTVVGAVPGALPAMGGWTAARGALDPQAWLLFAIVFFWQLPHFLTLAWMYREDYARGELPMLPTLDPTGERTRQQILLNTLALLAVSLTPAMVRLAGPVYFFGALGLGLAFLSLGLPFMAIPTNVFARRFYLASVIYLPALLALLLVDKFIV